MRASAIVVAHEFFEDDSKVSLVDWDQIIETFPPDGADEALAEGIGLGSPQRCFQHTYAEVLECEVERRRENGIPIMQDEPIVMWLSEDFPKLLRGPFCGRMLGDIAVISIATKT